VDINAGWEHRTWQVKSPFEKGGFRGISSSYKNPPCPPLIKGGKKTWFSRVTLILKHTTIIRQPQEAGTGEAFFHPTVSSRNNFMVKLIPKFFNN
jgi:hypothetical protein